MPPELMDFSSENEEDSDDGWNEVTEAVQPSVKVLHDRWLVIPPVKPIKNIFCERKVLQTKVAEE